MVDRISPRKLSRSRQSFAITCAALAAATLLCPGQHAMNVIGYITNADLAARVPNAPQGACGGYFILKNSWGSWFGDGGHLNSRSMSKSRADPVLFSRRIDIGMYEGARE
jgi:hypothetical protein